MTIRQTGTVTKYVDSAGYGFIAPTNGDADIFFHFKQFKSDADITLGAEVEYAVVEDRKRAGRYRAIDIELVGAGAVWGGR